MRCPMSGSAMRSSGTDVGMSGSWMTVSTPAPSSCTAFRFRSCVAQRRDEVSAASRLRTVALRDRQTVALSKQPCCNHHHAMLSMRHNVLRGSTGTCLKMPAGGRQPTNSSMAS